MKKIALSILLLMIFFILLMLLNSCGDEIITGEYKKYSFVCDNSEYGFYTTIDVYNNEVVMISENQKPEPINDNCYKTSYFLSFCPDFDKMEANISTYNGGSKLYECSGKITEINLD